MAKAQKVKPAPEPVAKAQFVEVPVPWDGDDIGIHCCPVCGASVRDEDLCPHVVFVWLDEAGEFQTRDEGVAALLEPITDALGDDEEADNDEPPHPARLACELLELPSAVCLYFGATFTGPGMAVCFDFSIEPDEVEDDEDEDA